jgi:hypothetical protein
MTFDLRELRMLRHEPELSIDQEGRWFVHLGSRQERVYELREQLARPESQDVLQQLQRLGIPLGWLALPDFDPATQKRLRGAGRLEPMLAQMEEETHVLALSLAVLLLDRADEKQLELPTAQQYHLAKHVLPVLNGTVVAIEMDLPWELREHGEALFRVERTAAGVRGSWVRGPAPPLDLGGLLRHQAATAGGFTQRTAAEFAQIVVQALLDCGVGQSVLPGLPVQETAADAVTLVWRKRSRRALYKDPSGPARGEME